MTIILYAIPGFLVLIAIELILENIRKTDYYRLNDAITSLSIGVLSRVVDVVKHIIPFTIYFAVFDFVAVFELSAFQSLQTGMSFSETAMVLGVWAFAFVFYDFLYYWNHRLGHEISILWAAHVVHHSSEEYNLTTALRQTSGSFLSWVFYLPLAVVGVPPLVFISVASLNLIYQFWVHTRHVPKLGWYESIFVTPSSHRVHHAQNQIYLDRNYGGVFILWDRMFGTFQEELDDEKPIYGVRKALESWNPLRANWQVYSQLCKDSWHTQKFVDKCRVWFGRTGWRPDDVAQKYPIELSDLNTFEKYNTSLSLHTKLYCLMQYSLTVVLALILMINGQEMATSAMFGLAFVVTYNLFSIGMVLENRPFIVIFEYIKNIAIVLFSMLFVTTIWLGTTLQTVALMSLILLFLSQRQSTSDDNRERSHTC